MDYPLIFVSGISGKLMTILCEQLYYVGMDTQFFPAYLGFHQSVEVKQLFQVRGGGLPLSNMSVSTTLPINQ
jgi:hypothetical protein